MIIQTKKDQFRASVSRAGKWVRHWIMMLVATYIVFTVAVNFLGINQRGASLLVSVGFFAIIICALVYVSIMIRKSKKLFTDDLVDKLMKTKIEKAYEPKGQ